MDPVTIKVEGMTCAGCATAVRSAIENVPGVESAQVDLATGLATVAGDQPKTTSIIEAIMTRGYKAEAVEAVLDASGIRSQIEQTQLEHERLWRTRAIIGLSTWAPLELLHWIAASSGFDHGLLVPIIMWAGATLVLATAGWGFYKSAFAAARGGTTNMDTLISIGATTAYVYSVVVFVCHQLGLMHDEPLYFAESAGLLGLISLGHWLDSRAAAGASAAVRKLLHMQPDEAELVEADDQTRMVRTSTITPGQEVMVRPGGRVPVDGVILEGRSSIDESIITGESIPIDKEAGQEVIAGSTNTTGILRIKSTVDGGSTTVARMARLVQQAQSSRANIQRLADKVSSVFVPAVLLIGLVTFLCWWLLGDDVPRGAVATVTVLIISCPCALGLATPMAVMVGAGEASLRGILVKSAQALEQAGSVNTVVFDKTGTLTIGSPEVTSVQPEPGHDAGEVLSLAASVENASEHPIGAAIVRAAREKGLEVAPVEDFQSVPGQGVSGLVNGRRVDVTRDPKATCKIIIDDVEAGLVTVADTPRPDSRRAVEELQRLGLDVFMLTGDRHDAAIHIAESIGLDRNNVIADATPESKLSTIKSFKGSVAMVGDGINDAAALASADLGIAMGSGTNIAIESAQLVIPGDQVTSIPQAVTLARMTLRTIKQNLFLAFVYNAAAIPVAALGLLGAHGPLIAAIAMACSDASVIGNALRLKSRLRKGRVDSV